MESILCANASSQFEVVSDSLQSVGLAVSQHKNGSKSSRRVYCSLAALLLTAMTVSALGQSEPVITTGTPTDWTHHRMVFSAPATAAELGLKGEEAKEKDAQSQAVLHSTRYALQQMRRDPSKRPILPLLNVKDPSTPTAIHKDWSKLLTTTGQVNPNAYPAKFSYNNFSTTAASCTSDYVVYPTGTAGSGTTTPTILAYNELYGTSGPSGTGCGAGTSGGAVPSTYWAYNTAFAYNSTTANSALVKTSPVLSLDGSQVAFIQTTGSAASLVLLKWKASSSVVSLNTTTNNTTLALYRNCTAPCMTQIPLMYSAVAQNDTWSAPYYDYADDKMWVGDDGGTLHSFTGVFNGTPAEGNPLNLGTNAKLLASPVYDPTTGYIFVGSTAGYLYSVTSTGAIRGTSSGLAYANPDGIYDAPLVDSAAGKVYVFVGKNSGSNNAVYQFATSFTSGSGTLKALGTGTIMLFDGDFDNIYYSSTGGVAGNLYVVANAGATGGGTLYRIPIGAASAMGTAVTTVINQTNPVYPSPVTEFRNNGGSACVASGTATTTGKDYIFFSVLDFKTGLGGSCLQGTGDTCVLSYNVSTGAPVYAQYLSVVNGSNCFGTGGIVIDNSVPSGSEVGASQMYFMKLNGTATNLCGTANTGAAFNAVQTSQF